MVDFKAEKPFEHVDQDFLDKVVQIKIWPEMDILDYGLPQNAMLLHSN